MIRFFFDNCYSDFSKFYSCSPGYASFTLISSILLVITIRFLSYSSFGYSLLLFPMESNEDNTPQQQHEEGDTDTGGSKNCTSKSHYLFPPSDPSRKTQRRQAQCRLYEIQCEQEKIKLEAEDDSEE